MQTIKYRFVKRELDKETNESLSKHVRRFTKYKRVVSVDEDSRSFVTNKPRFSTRSLSSMVMKASWVNRRMEPQARYTGSVATALIEHLDSLIDDKEKLRRERNRISSTEAKIANGQGKARQWEYLESIRPKPKKGKDVQIGQTVTAQEKISVIEKFSQIAQSSTPVKSYRFKNIKPFGSE